jgi:transcriptional regulator with XRE-family HTH domain
MKTIEYLDAIQAKYSLPSDYAISKMLGITRAAVSHYRSGENYLNDAVAKKAASLLGVHPGIVLLDMYAERTNCDETRSIWEEVQRGFHAPSRRAKRVRAHA